MLFRSIISILLLLKKTKLFIKKIVLINYFIASIIIWYLKVNNILFTIPYLNNFFKFESFNFANIFFLLSVEILYYLWSYISYDTRLSDWSIPKPKKTIIYPIFNIMFFYLMIILYYSILSKYV